MKLIFSNKKKSRINIIIIYFIIIVIALLSLSVFVFYLTQRTELTFTKANLIKFPEAEINKLPKAIDFSKAINLNNLGKTDPFK